MIMATMPKLRQCWSCGSPYPNGSRGGRPICPECKEILLQEKVATRRKRKHYSHGTAVMSYDALTIVSDPDDCGGQFQPGNVIMASENHHMLLDGYYTENTILKNKKGEYFKVVWNCEKTKQVLIPIDCKEILNGQTNR